ncbi:hypothetical protein [Pelagibius sp.]|uniref:hypothetical protein n=1 Tax=Pelagibius sp. TaxID=1931238 RepID=UPI003B514EC9
MSPTPEDLASRVEVVRRRDDFERHAAAFLAKWKRKDGQLRRKLTTARQRLDDIQVPDGALERVAELCMKLGTDGLRGELTMIRAARALAALEGAKVLNDDHLRRVAPSALRHRLRRDPLDEAGSGVRVERALQEVFGA